MKNLVALSLLLLLTQAAIKEDLMAKVPGFGDDYKGNVYSGYLNTSDPTRRLHYVFVQSAQGPTNKDPVTLWLNGGPGCSSLLGFIQQIGPYYIEEGKNYTVGDKLTPNPYSWHTVSNLLFLESPAGVGYSINTNSSFQYSDLTTQQDNFEAIKNFFLGYPQYKDRDFWISGESYAGKYIPDLGFRIDHYNLDPSTPADKKINFTGMFIGNGVIDFRGGSLYKSTVQYFINHDFIDPETLSYWNAACQYDEESAGCQFFYSRFQETLNDVNPYNIYSYCYYNDSFAMDGNQAQKKQFLSQQSILMSLSKQVNGIQKTQQGNENQPRKSKFNGAPCAYFDGMYQYFNAHYLDYKATPRASQKIKWNGPCAQDISDKYIIEQSGSFRQMEYLMTRLNSIQLVLYNGDWDGVVPFVDTLKNLDNLKVSNPSLFSPIIYKDQHIGFNTVLSGLNFVLVKGASHQVPQAKRDQSLYIFSTLIEAYEKGKPLQFN